MAKGNTSGNTSKGVSVKASLDEIAAWKRASGPASFNSWARAALNAAARGADVVDPVVDPYWLSSRPGFPIGVSAKRSFRPDPK